MSDQAIYTDNRITLFIDLYGVVASLSPELLAQPDPQKRTVLVVDHSVFFREQMSSFLIEMGFLTIAVKDLADAVDKLSRNAIMSSNEFRAK